MNGAMAVPAGYYGLPEFPKVPTSFGVAAPHNEPCHPGSEKDPEIPLEMLARFTPTGIMKREALLRRAAEGSLEFRMRASKDEPTNPTDRALEPSKQSAGHLEEVKNVRSGYAVADGYHRHLSSGHVCLGCQGNVSYYQGATP